jgi:hypothetical protein
VTRRPPPPRHVEQRPDREARRDQAVAGEMRLVKARDMT